MSEDWRQNVDRHEAAEAARKAKEREEQLRREREQKERQAQAERDAEQRRIAGWQKGFKCHICGTMSSGPNVIRKVVKSQGGRGGFEPKVISSSSRTDWSTPRDLTRCSKCNRWACAKDYYNGYCASCAKKL